MRQLIFVVDDQSEFCHWAKQCLEVAGYDVHTFSSCDVIANVEASPPSLLLIRMGLLEGNGLALCRPLLRDPRLARIAVIFVLDEVVEEHRLLALESGADDCMVKPFNARELVARVQAVLRRSALAASKAQTDTADLVIDSWAMKLSVRGIEVPTTTLEFRLIEHLARHRGQVFTRDLLLDAVWGEMEFITPRSVDACIRRIREKIEPDRAKPTLLKTVRGVGYRLDATAAWQSVANGDCDCAACRSKSSPARFTAANDKRRRLGARKSPFAKTTDTLVTPAFRTRTWGPTARGRSFDKTPNE